jgi:hypothetical protein
MDADRLADRSHMVAHESQVAATRKICWFVRPDPMSLEYFFTTKSGLQNMLLYAWMLKDLAWMQGWFYPALIFASVSVTITFGTIVAALVSKDLNEIFHSTASFLWIFACLWWMSGELYNLEDGIDDSVGVYPVRASEAKAIFLFGLTLVGTYYIIVKPIELYKPDYLSHYFNVADENDLQGILPAPRFKYFFKSWEQYTNTATFFWLGIDTSWNAAYKPMFIVFAFPMLLLSADCVFLTFFGEDVVGHAHEFAQLIWIVANIYWAVGEFISTGDKEILYLSSQLSPSNIRWVASWILVSGFLPLIFLYVLWVRATIYPSSNKKYARKTIIINGTAENRRKSSISITLSNNSDKSDIELVSVRQTGS